MESFFVFKKIGSKVDQHMPFLLEGRKMPKNAVRGRYCNKADNNNNIESCKLWTRFSQKQKMNYPFCKFLYEMYSKLPFHLCIICYSLKGDVW